ncbi:putative Ser/Thr protein kinase [Streptosporangium becharense]|uniref:non-specific serine/threonine protein kinase n=1 Tax=Streptosporangium becharense TaxID=1816182 RepID=A0A7W9IE23_9ACTN|nr:serine/threonine-protein kinase [Streptosporangium becharense]MBB2911907.1 putative Ser/Thr protein kinase [Streptosporangium becharense]MBB5818454.1 putative Ser/Thr protein kinase [Streptosporangium becharense]
MADLASLRPGDPEYVREYRLTARLGEGGQGTVYLGESPTGARVAVKLLRADLTQDAEAMERFVREVSTTRRVSPFCTAAVLDTGVEHERPYIVSEFIDGPTLHEVVTGEGPREGAALHRLAIGTVTALVAIHQAEIVHRDFKPTNVLLAPDGPRVIDFGIAKALDRTSTLTAMAIGTPAYMTPEQLEGKNAGSPADMFAWGCTMVFAATGSPPFGTDSLPAIFNRIMNLTPDLSAITDPALRELVGQCLAKDPAQRPTAGEALMRLLGHATGASTGSALPAAPQGILAEGSAVAAQYTGPGPGGYPPGTMPGGAPFSPNPPEVADRTWYGGASTGGYPHAAEPYGPPQQPGTGGYPMQTGPQGYARPDGFGPHGGGQTGYASQSDPRGYPPQQGHGVTGNFPPQPGHGTTGNFPPQSGYATAGYPPQPGHGTTGNFPPQSGYATTAGYPPQQGHGVTGNFPPQQGHPVGPAHQTYGNGPTFPSSAVHQGVQRGPAYPPQAAPVKKRGPWLAVAAGVAATILVIAGVVAVLNSGSSDTRAGGSDSSGTATPTPKAASVPAASNEIKLPGGAVTFYESDLDPIRLTSYSIDNGETLYIRKPGTDQFTKNDKYFEYVPNVADTQALAIDRQFDSAGYWIVSVVDQQTGAASKIRITKSPIFPRLPQWSPDGKFGLVTLTEAAGENEFKPYGFAVIDIAAKKAKLVRINQADASEWSYFWRSDGRAVGSWVLTEKTQRIRFYDLEGTILQTLLDVGSPVAVEGYDVSPSGSSIVTYCKGTTKEICVWSVTSEGPAQARIPFETDRLIGWYDDKHIAGWRRKGSGYEAVVFDLKGKVQRVMATTKAQVYEKQFMIFTRNG